MLATKLRHGDANTMMAEGGIQAASKGHKDSPYYHYLDVMGGGHFTNVPELVETLVSKAPDAIKWMEGLGVNFSKKRRRHPQDHSRRRHVAQTHALRRRHHRRRDHAHHPRRGAQHAPIDIQVLEFSPAVDLVLNEHGHCAGAVLYNMETQEYFVVKAKSVVMATGGCGRLHIQGFMTTNHYGATADGIVLGYRAGVPVSFLHTVQYHPTGIVFPEQAEGILITEKFRGSGANLVNVEGNQFVNEREPRDVEAASIIKECVHDGKGVPTPTGRLGIWLDSPMIEDLAGEGTVKREFPGKYILYKRFDIDISKEPMLIYPTLHYQNGGVEFQPRMARPGSRSLRRRRGGRRHPRRQPAHGQLAARHHRLRPHRGHQRVAVHRRRRQGRQADPRSRRAKYNAEVEAAGITDGRVAPAIIPDYTDPEVRERQLTANYVGNVR
jgi:succinate dehydrogenase/fumarate reductase flavoprotein subunit